MCVRVIARQSSDIFGTHCMHSDTVYIVSYNLVSKPFKVELPWSKCTKSSDQHVCELTR